MSKRVYETHSRTETEELAEKLAGEILSGAVIALKGDLGAGKTCFTAGFAKGMGYLGSVNSPTFAIVNEYKGGRLDIYHFDMYRVDGEEALYSCGFFDYLDAGGICIAEWCENITDFIPDGAVKVSISKLSDSPDARRISIE